MKTTNKITTRINDQVLEIEGDKAFMPLGSYLRNEQSLTGTKIVCSEGDCGACTVLIAKSVGSDGRLEFKSVNSCILPLYLINGAQVVTVEGIGKSQGMNFELHEVQKSDRRVRRSRIDLVTQPSKGQENNNRQQHRYCLYNETNSDSH